MQTMDAIQSFNPGVWYGQAVQQAIPLDLTAPASQSPAAWAIALVAAVVPAAVMGGVLGAHLSEYNEKQRQWGRRGAFAGAGLALGVLALAGLKMRETA